MIVVALVRHAQLRYLVVVPLAEPDAVPDVPPVVPVVPLEPVDPVEPLEPVVEPPALPIVVLGDALVSLAVPLPVVPLALPDMEPEVPEEAVVLGVDELVSLEAVELDVDGVEAEVLGVLVLLLVLLRSQPAAKVATVMAAKMGIRRFMTSPVQCVKKLLVT